MDRGFETRWACRWGFFLYAAPVISTQFLLRAREGNLTYPDELWRRLRRRICG